MKDKIYPAIYESSTGERYLYADYCNYHPLNGNEWCVADEIDKRAALTDKNITREFLTNTYGEVVSKEHADFIIELAENTGFISCGYGHNDNLFSFKDGKLVFIEVKDTSKPPHFAPKSKKITIPLTPKASQCEFLPKVGDTVQTSSGKGFVMMAPDNHGLYVIDIKGFHSLLSINELQKPKDSEEELRDELDFDISFLIDTASNSKYIVDRLLSKYDIKKKDFK